MSLHEFLELVSNKLNLGADNDLNSGLARTDDAGNTSGLDLLLVYEQGVLDLEAQTGDAVVNRGDVASAAQTFQNDLSRGGKVVVCQLGTLVSLCRQPASSSSRPGSLEVELR